MNRPAALPLLLAFVLGQAAAPLHHLACTTAPPAEHAGGHMAAEPETAPPSDQAPDHGCHCQTDCCTAAVTGLPALPPQHPEFFARPAADRALPTAAPASHLIAGLPAARAPPATL